MLPCITPLQLNHRNNKHEFIKKSKINLIATKVGWKETVQHNTIYLTNTIVQKLNTTNSLDVNFVDLN